MARRWHVVAVVDYPWTFAQMDLRARHSENQVATETEAEESLDRRFAVGRKEDTRQRSDAFNIDRKTVGNGWQGNRCPAHRPARKQRAILHECHQQNADDVEEADAGQGPAQCHGPQAALAEM